MGVVEKRERGEGIEQLGETEGARRATGVFPSAAPAGGVCGRAGGSGDGGGGEGAAAALHRGVQAADRARGGPLHEAGRAWRAAAARGPVLLALDELARGAGSRRARGARPEAARAEGDPGRSAG